MVTTWPAKCHEPTCSMRRPSVRAWRVLVAPQADISRIHVVAMMPRRAPSESTAPRPSILSPAAGALKRHGGELAHGVYCLGLHAEFDRRLQILVSENPADKFVIGRVLLQDERCGEVAELMRLTLCRSP